MPAGKKEHGKFLICEIDIESCKDGVGRQKMGFGGGIKNVPMTLALEA